MTLEPKTPTRSSIVSKNSNKNYNGEDNIKNESFMHKDNSSAEFYKQKAIEEARRNLQPKIVDTKEIYRTNGYLSRENSPQTEKEKGYNANYKNIKRLSSPTTYDNSSRTLQSSAVRDTTDYSKVHGLNYSTGDFRV